MKKLELLISVWVSGTAAFWGSVLSKQGNKSDMLHNRFSEEKIMDRDDN